MNCYCEKLREASVCFLVAIARPFGRGARVCYFAANLINLPLCRAGMIAAAIALALSIQILPAKGQELQRLPLDSASSLATTVSTDSVVKKEGKGSIKIATQGPANICLGRRRCLVQGTTSLGTREIGGRTKLTICNLIC